MKARSRVLTCLALSLPVLAHTGCGSDDQTTRAALPDPAPVLGRGLPPAVEHPAATAIDQLQRAFMERDYAGICAHITPAAARQAGEAGHGAFTTCERDVRRLVRMIRKGGGWRNAGKPRVIGIEATGPSSATATVALERRWRARIPISRIGGRWKLSGFLGAPPAMAQRIAKETPDAAFPPPRGERLELTGAGGDPCPKLSQARFPQISGGCEIELSGARAPLTILTPLGDFEFDDCALNYRVRADSSGRTWTEELDVSGHPKSPGCNDVRTCYDAATEQLVPWRGRLYRDGPDRLLHRTAACIRTCVGNFVGELTVQLVRDGDAWRAEPVDGGGDSGLRFDNALSVRGELGMETAQG